MAAQAKFFHVQSNRATPIAAEAPKLGVKLIDYDVAKIRPAPERRRLLSNWGEVIQRPPK